MVQHERDDPIQEVADYGAAAEYLLSEDHGKGIIWRLYSFARYEERDGGVYIELEAIALSRDVPATLRWVVDPIVRRVSRSSLATSLHQTADAVRPFVDDYEPNPMTTRGEIALRAPPSTPG